MQNLPLTFAAFFFCFGVVVEMNGQKRKNTDYNASTVYNASIVYNASTVFWFLKYFKNTVRHKVALLVQYIWLGSFVLINKTYRSNLK